MKKIANSIVAIFGATSMLIACEGNHMKAAQLAPVTTKETPKEKSEKSQPDRVITAPETKVNVTETMIEQIEKDEVLPEVDFSQLSQRKDFEFNKAASILLDTIYFSDARSKRITQLLKDKKITDNLGDAFADAAISVDLSSTFDLNQSDDKSSLTLEPNSWILNDAEIQKDYPLGIRIKKTVAANIQELGSQVNKTLNGSAPLDVYFSDASDKNWLRATHKIKWTLKDFKGIKITEQNKNLSEEEFAKLPFDTNVVALVLKNETDQIKFIEAQTSENSTISYTHQLNEIESKLAKIKTKKQDLLAKGNDYTEEGKTKVELAADLENQIALLQKEKKELESKILSFPSAFLFKSHTKILHITGLTDAEIAHQIPNTPDTAPAVSDTPTQRTASPAVAITPIDN